MHDPRMTIREERTLHVSFKSIRSIDKYWLPVRVDFRYSRSLMDAGLISESLERVTRNKGGNIHAKPISGEVNSF
jgi:hypothetical protein